MWDLPGPGLEPVSPALAGGFLTTAPPGKPLTKSFDLLTHFTHFSNPPHPLPLATTNLFSVSMCWVFFQTPYITEIIQYSSFSVLFHLAWCPRGPSCCHEWQDLILFYGFSYICFLHSSISGHLGGFHVLAIENNAAMSMGVHISFRDMILFPLELLDHMVVLFLIFWVNSNLFSIVSAPIYIPTNSARGFPFLHIFTNSCYFLSFL